MTVYISHKIID